MKKLIFVGRIEKEKNIQFLLKAFCLIHTEYPNVKLIIVGDGKSLPNLQKQIVEMDISEKIEFPGWVEHEDVISMLRQSDIFVTASQTEVFPLSTLEALSCGIPVLAIDGPGNREIVINDYNGFILSDNIQEFSKKVIWLLHNDTILQRLKVTSYISAKDYSIKNHIKSLMQVYEGLTNNKIN